MLKPGNGWKERKKRDLAWQHGTHGSGWCCTALRWIRAFSQIRSIDYCCCNTPALLVLICYICPFFTVYLTLTRACVRSWFANPPLYMECFSEWAGMHARQGTHLTTRRNASHPTMSYIRTLHYLNTRPPTYLPACLLVPLFIFSFLL